MVVVLCKGGKISVGTIYPWVVPGVNHLPQYVFEKNLPCDNL
jgi:hypothetical protein